ncbi:DUF3592 domain-containing protein [Bifidobacterium sp. 82T10]|uniref:DUF3592 domain-containing protein n=1 Tax=Bifidobacterium miconis TaxID=2834435 RepID=A0ABS6WCE4_9BIFI|nr:DUF3592 domain-containing protein [Bifidobacterium miconis]MBW3091700.1 DUF3592 domain-containing protein [Bifidobacterium miconis]
MLFGGAIMVVSGLLMLFMFVADIFGEHRLTKRATAMTVGTVLRRVEDKGSDDTVIDHHYVVRYEVDGIPYELNTRGIDYDREYHSGDPMDIDYDPDDPKAARATFNRPHGNTAWNIVFGSLCGAWTIGGAWIIAANIGPWLAKWE